MKEFKRKKKLSFHIKLFLVNIPELSAACNIEEVRRVEKYRWHLAIVWTNHINCILSL